MVVSITRESQASPYCQNITLSGLLLQRPSFTLGHNLLLSYINLAFISLLLLIILVTVAETEVVGDMLYAKRSICLFGLLGAPFKKFHHRIEGKG